MDEMNYRNPLTFVTAAASRVCHSLLEQGMAVSAFSVMLSAEKECVSVFFDVMAINGNARVRHEFTIEKSSYLAVPKTEESIHTVAREMVEYIMADEVMH